QQTERALERADQAILVVDGRTGITPMDRHFADWLRRQKIPVHLVVNKCESQASEAGIIEAYELGFGQPIPMSAEHGDGMGDLYDLLQPFVDAAADKQKQDKMDDEEAEIARALARYNEGDEVGFGDEEAGEEDLV